METLKKEFGEYKEGKFTITEDIRQEYTINVEDSLAKLKELESTYNNIPKQIETLEKNKEAIKKHYQDWLDVLVEVKEKYGLKELELPESLD